ncbi:hypothetical protein KM539_09065 [Xanthomonas translucens pv. poae]|uniref:hypothetical protein n=1 Tax=Xanthomonas graminis TaxID=3390026 RepID=UPI0006B30698|nr:hypothetical protein [Xanthomonas translucens]UKE63563.1 hypothetical protein KM539_09065 [Xanthomonas translucens pv. poae]
MLEFVGIVAICAACIWLARYLWSFWKFRQSINALEALASAVKAKADFVAAKAGPEAAEKTYFIAICLKSLADSLTYGRIANLSIAGKQLEVLDEMLKSPEDVAFYMDRSINSVADIMHCLLGARDSFVSLHRAFGRMLDK